MSIQFLFSWKLKNQIVNGKILKENLTQKSLRVDMIKSPTYEIVSAHFMAFYFKIHRMCWENLNLVFWHDYRIEIHHKESVAQNYTKTRRHIKEMKNSYYTKERAKMKNLFLYDFIYSKMRNLRKNMENVNKIFTLLLIVKWGTKNSNLLIRFVKIILSAFMFRCWKKLWTLQKKIVKYVRTIWWDELVN